MKVYSKLAALFASGSLLIAGAVTPASAASIMTEAFLANVRPNIDFLDRSSRLALDHSRNGGIRSFAHDEAREQTFTANALVAYTQTNTISGAVAAIGDDTAVAVPSAGGVSFAVPDLTTGRSVALDVPEPPLTVTRAAPPPGSTLLPAGQADLDRLSRLNGRAFDALYRSTQWDALRQLATLYASYVQNGDDPSLRALSSRELPKINLRLTELRKL